MKKTTLLGWHKKPIRKQTLGEQRCRVRNFKSVPKITQQTALTLQTSKSQTTALLSPPVPPSSKSRYSFQRRHTQFQMFYFFKLYQIPFSLVCVSSWWQGSCPLSPLRSDCSSVQKTAQFCVAPSVSQEPPEVSVGFSQPPPHPTAMGSRRKAGLVPPGGCHLPRSPLLLLCLPPGLGFALR